MPELNSLATLPRRKIKAVLIFLFAFLIILLAALCYALFNFLTAAPEPNTRAPWIVTAEGDIDDNDDSSTEEATSPGNPVDPASPAVTVPPVIRTTSSIATPGIYPMGRAPLFCTFGVHRQDYDKINVDACDYAFIPFYLQGRDTFADDSNPITQKLISRAVASTKTNRSAVRQHLNSKAGKDRIRQYWTTKSIYHYAVFDIGVRPNESSHSERIMKEAFDLLKMFRDRQKDLQASDPGQVASPRRGFVVASFYLWPSTQSPALVELSKNLRNFIVDGLIVLTHLTVDEHQAGLPCVITGGAPYEINVTTNLLGMVNVMRHIQKQTEWNRKLSMAISVSMCTRVYMPEKHADLDEKCVDHIRRPNSTAAFCNDPHSIYGGPTTVRCGHYTALSTSENTPPLVATFETNETVSEKAHIIISISFQYCKIKKNFTDLSIGLAIFDVECEDWQQNCTDLNTPIPGIDRFRDIAAYVTSVANVTGNQLPCK
ncbi:hypothetical protein HPB49_017426 [Dermacentor silvarum]|uniref:Uncharacterized protein n=1 Tax=Dermacentor silvarum TaxID=543639 RepID=A0ACB8D734_DERSI|nr:hypothetical protein HPB49_017426 [Dermacentor silvarum]